VTHFTTRRAAKILGLSEQRIRWCVGTGFLSPFRGPGRRFQFTFQDLLLLKTAKGLLESRVSLKRVRRMLASLKRQLPDDRHLTSVTIYADGKRIVAWGGATRWQPDSGQFLFNFEAQAIAARVALPPVPAAAPPPALTAEEWFHLAAELEASSPEEAQRAYHQALELDPTLSDAHVNLGCLCEEAKNPVQAEAHYRLAIEHAPSDPIPHFNLAALLGDLGRADEAVRAYHEAIARRPDWADAHYNLGLLYEAVGKRPEAIRHFRRARTLYGRSSNPSVSRSRPTPPSR
jgi:tetratricopeptide (TPR) repeat protein